MKHCFTIYFILLLHSLLIVQLLRCSSLFTNVREISGSMQNLFSYCLLVNHLDLRGSASFRDHSYLYRLCQDRAVSCSFNITTVLARLRWKFICVHINGRMGTGPSPTDTCVNKTRCFNVLLRLSKAIIIILSQTGKT